MSAMLTPFADLTDRWWTTLGYDEGQHQAVVSALPEGWIVTHDWSYCGSSICRNVEVHREHSEPEHSTCYRTFYGGYPSVMDDVRLLGGARE